MTLVFPDRAPSRFAVALRAGTVSKLRERSLTDDGVQSAEGRASEYAVALIAKLGRHDRLTRGHAERVRAHADLIAEEMGLSDQDRTKLAWAALLHDVGKLSVPPEILNKTGRPDDDEWRVLRRHPGASTDLLAPLVPWLGEWLNAASQHHERWDGAGYPQGLRGNDISLAGRIVAVADAYDVITSTRSYKKASSAAAARDEMTRSAGTQFDPTVVRALLSASLRRSPASTALVSLAELPQVVNLGVNVPAASAVLAGTVATVASVGLSSPPPPALAFSSEPAPVVEPAPPLPDWLGLEPTEPATTAAPASTTAPSTSTVPSTSSQPSSTTTTEPTTTTAVEAGQTTSPPTTPAPATSAAPTTQPPGAPATTTTTAPPATTTLPPTTTTLPPTTTTTAPAGPPLLVNDNATVEQGQWIQVMVLENDDPGGSPFDGSTLRIVQFPDHGIAGTWPYEDRIYYRSWSSYEGQDQVVYEICNTGGLCSQATVVFDVQDD